MSQNRKVKDMFCRADANRPETPGPDHSWSDRAARMVIAIFCLLGGLVVMTSLFLKMASLRHYLPWF